MGLWSYARDAARADFGHADPRSARAMPRHGGLGGVWLSDRWKGVLDEDDPSCKTRSREGDPEICARFAPTPVRFSGLYWTNDRLRPGWFARHTAHQLCLHLRAREIPADGRAVRPFRGQGLFSGPGTSDSPSARAKLQVPPSVPVPEPGPESFVGLMAFCPQRSVHRQSPLSQQNSPLPVHPSNLECIPRNGCNCTA